MGQKPRDEFDIPEYPDFVETAQNGNQWHPSTSSKNPVVDSTPDELTEMLVALDTVKEFTVNIQRISNGVKTHCGKKFCILPDPHAIGEEYGMGNYILTVAWNVPDRKPPMWKRLTYNLDSSYNEIHRQWMLARSPIGTQNGSAPLETDIERLIKLQSAFGSREGKDSSTTLILDMVKEQNRLQEKQLDRIREEQERDRKEHRELFKELLSGIKTMSSAKPESKSLGDQLIEFKSIAGLLGFSNGQAPEAPPDDRPTWMIAVDMIGEKLLPLLSAFSQDRGLKRNYAEKQLQKAMNPDNAVVANLMQNQEQQRLFIAEVCSKAATPEMRQGAVNLATKLGIQLPVGFSV